MNQSRITHCITYEAGVGQTFTPNEKGVFKHVKQTKKIQKPIKIHPQNKWYKKGVPKDLISKRRSRKKLLLKKSSNQ